MRVRRREGNPLERRYVCPHIGLIPRLHSLYVCGGGGGGGMEPGNEASRSELKIRLWVWLAKLKF